MKSLRANVRSQCYDSSTPSEIGNGSMGALVVIATARTREDLSALSKSGGGGI